MKDYELFLTSGTEAPSELSSAVLKKIQELTNPSAWSVFVKILAVHFVVGFLSLSVCHQFGMNPFHTDWSLADWFMETGGHYFCMFGCGLTFVSAGILAAGFLLSKEEIRALKRTEILQNLSLGIISLGVFITFGVELAVTIAGLWLLGALLGGFVAVLALTKLKPV